MIYVALKFGKGSSKNSGIRTDSSSTDQGENSNQTGSGDSEGKLNLLLKGTVVDPKTASVAFILNTIDRKEGVYHEGDSIGSWKIQSITQGQVILKNSKGEQKILLAHKTKPKVLTPASPLEGTTVKPYLQGNEFKGLLITELNSRSILGRCGVKKGDIIYTINKQPLINQKAAMGKWNKLKDTPQATIKVNRNGKILTFSYDIKK